MTKRAIITGGTKGIGRALVEKFASQGYDIATCARNEQDLAELKQSVESANKGVIVWTKSCDVTDPTQIIEWCQAIKSHWSSADILVNNAGIFLPGSVLKEEEQNLLLQLDVNVLSAYRFTRLLIELLQNNNEGGHIFNMCSIASRTAYPHGGSYTISKFALYGFSQCLREELKPTTIKVTSVMPGATWSDSWKGSSFTSGDMMSATDIASLVWACSQLSKQAVVEELLIRPQGGDL